MEPLQVFGVSEECQSSESGWTMYIGSPADGSSDADADAPSDENQDHDDGKVKGFYGSTDANHQNDSDDSMASDASSGPSHQQGHPFGRHGNRMKNHNDLALFKHKNEVNFGLEGKTKKPLMEKQRGDRKEVEEKLGLVGQKPKSSVQSSSKVRKSIWMGKRN